MASQPAKKTFEIYIHILKKLRQSGNENHTKNVVGKLFSDHFLKNQF